jgi:hypothetical protein
MLGAGSTGWIPVVSGNMSFKELGTTRFCQKYRVVNEIDPNTNIQTIVIAGQKNLNDGWLPSPVRQSLEGLIVRFYFLLVLRSEAERGRPRSKLTGFIAISVDQGILRLIEQIANNNIHATELLETAALLEHDARAYGAGVSVQRDGRCDLLLPNR